MLINSIGGIYQTYKTANHTQQKTDLKDLSSDRKTSSVKNTVKISEEAKQAQKLSHLNKMIGEDDLKKLNAMYDDLGRMVPESKDGILLVDGFKVNLALDKHMAKLNGKPETTLGANYIRDLIKKTKISNSENGMDLNYLQSALNYFTENKG